MLSVQLSFKTIRNLLEITSALNAHNMFRDEIRLTNDEIDEALSELWAKLEETLENWEGK